MQQTVNQKEAKSRIPSSHYVDIVNSAGKIGYRRICLAHSQHASTWPLITEGLETALLIKELSKRLLFRSAMLGKPFPNGQQCNYS